ncbi:ribonuclease H-like domain-containing protein [Clostridium sp. P21]|uniref:Ribonuclease H-like domain-containing protein n=1 Tax=Clostridium muellerianum TaxID=2716538 RepID=A0A7Y0EIQ2_9CLOT|nr:ribonuclease H-like domain-containing protein [Clostridium muellerianum]
MIERHDVVEVEEILEENLLSINGKKHLFKDAIFFDLEHYIYKKPICIGVFGCCYFDDIANKLNTTQYMIENRKDAKAILTLAKDYFYTMSSKYGKKYLVTFSGNNDFTVINYLFEKYNINFNIEEHFKHIDLQKEYEREKKVCIGLKALEKEFGITRESEVISGSNLAKTFSKIVKDSGYVQRMPEEKRDKILLYNEQDVVSLFQIYVNWNIVMKRDKILEG